MNRPLVLCEARFILHARELACAQYKLPIVLEVSHAAKAIFFFNKLADHWIFTYKSYYFEYNFARNKEETTTGIKNSMYVNVYCL